MSMKNCLLKHAKEFENFDVDGVVGDAAVYQSRGKSEDEANAQAIEDHLESLRSDRERVVGEVLQQFKDSDPKGYAKIEASLAQEKADAEAEAAKIIEPEIPGTTPEAKPANWIHDEVANLVLHFKGRTQQRKTLDKVVDLLKRRMAGEDVRSAQIKSRLSSFKAEPKLLDVLTGIHARMEAEDKAATAEKRRETNQAKKGNADGTQALEAQQAEEKEPQAPDATGAVDPARINPGNYMDEYGENAWTLEKSATPDDTDIYVTVGQGTLGERTRAVTFDQLVERVRQDADFLASKGMRRTDGGAYERIEPATDAPPIRKGDRFTDGQGRQWEVWNARTGHIEAFPIIDGKMRVSNQDGQFWSTDAQSRAAFPDGRTDFTMLPKDKKPVTPQLIGASPIVTQQDDNSDATLSKLILDAAATGSTLYGQNVADRLYGPDAEAARQKILAAVTSKPVPKSKAGHAATMRALFDRFKIPQDAIVTMNRALEKALRVAAGLETPEAIKAPAVEAEKPTTDDDGNRIYREGERVEFAGGMYAGRHGAISSATAFRTAILSYGAGARSNRETISYSYTIKTDNGTYTHASANELKLETSKPESVVLDPVVNGRTMPPEMLHRGIGTSKTSAENSRDSARRARKPSSIAEHKRSAERYDKDAADYQKAWDEWAQRYPEEAERIVPKKAPASETVAAAATVPPAGAAGDALKAAGLVVTKGTTNKGTDVWNVSGNTKENSDLLKRLGGRWFGPKKVWGFFGGDPSATIAARLKPAATAPVVVLGPNEVMLAGNPYTYRKELSGGWTWRMGAANPNPMQSNAPVIFELEKALANKNPIITGKPAIEATEKVLEVLAGSEMPGSDKARAEIAARDDADDADIDAMLRDVVAEEEGRTPAPAAVDPWKTVLIKSGTLIEIEGQQYHVRNNYSEGHRNDGERVSLRTIGRVAQVVEKPYEAVGAALAATDSMDKIKAHMAAEKKKLADAREAGAMAYRNNEDRMPPQDADSATAKAWLDGYDNAPPVEKISDPTKPAGYAKALANPEILEQYQDEFDAFFQERLIETRKAMRSLGWDGDPLQKNGKPARFDFRYAGFGKNVVGMTINGVQDDLELTPNQLAKYHDDLVSLFEKGDDSAAKPDTVRLPQEVAEAISGQMGKAKRRMMRLRTESESSSLNLESKISAQTKTKAAEATLSQLRKRIFEAEDAAVKALASKNISDFAEFEMLFPDAHAAIALAIGAVSPLTQALNDLSEMKARAESQGRVVDDRLLNRIRQQEKIVAELEAEKSSNSQNDELDAEMRSYEAKAAAPKKPVTPQVAAPAGSTPLGAARTAAQAAGSAVSNTAKSFDSAINALGKLFGGTPGTLGMGPVFNEDTYAAAKPHFAAAIAHLKNAGSDIKEAMRLIYRAVKEAFGPGVAEGMLPYISQYGKDLRNGKIVYDEIKEADNEQSTADGATGDLPLEGTSSENVPGTQGGGNTGKRSPRRGGKNGAGTGGTGSAGVSTGSGMGSGTGDLFVSPGGTGEQPGSAGLGSVSGDSPAKQSAVERPADYVITAETRLGMGGAKAKFHANVAALRLVNELEQSGRQATPAEQHVLARYVGWGALSQAFDPSHKDWVREHAELKELLTADEWDAAEMSTQYAHYTSEKVITHGIYAALRHFGFSGGRILEPGSGVGNTAGLMPADFRTGGARITGIERERIAARIAQHLYPNQIMLLEDFTKFNAADGEFDAVAGNPPFSRTGLVDESGRKHLNGLSIHNYFFAKSIDMLRPGGVFAMVVSNGFMDAKTDRARAYIGQTAKFLGAIRLPNNAFKSNAGTEVTTDIIFLQKREEADWGSKHAKDDLKAWNSIETIPDPLGGEPIPLNTYFVANPHMMLGRMERSGSMYRAGTAALTDDNSGPIEERLQEAIQSMPANVYQAALTARSDAIRLAALVPLHDRAQEIGSYYVEGDHLFVRVPDIAGEKLAQAITPNTQWTEKKVLGEKQFAKLKALAEIRATTSRLLAAELADDIDLMGEQRTMLNTQYDALVKKHGPISTDTTRQLIGDDPFYPLLVALETNFDKGISDDAAKKNGVSPVKPSAKKMPIFMQRVIPKHVAVTSAETPVDALMVSISERGRIDPGYMAQLLKRTDVESVLKELEDSGHLINDPDTSAYVLRDEYLSGNVRKKLETAKRKQLFRNVEALEAVLPEDIPAHDIVGKMGAAWVPTDEYEVFIKELFGEGTTASVRYQSTLGSYQVEIDAGSELANTNTWGVKEGRYTDDKGNEKWGPGIDGTKIVESILNKRPIRVGTYDDDGKFILNADQTAMANDKAADIKTKFSDWLFQDADRSDRLVRTFNDTVNNYVTRIFDGSLLKFPGKVPDAIIKLRRHQRDAVARIIQAGGALLDHVVGSGKTFTVIAAAMELRRTNLAHKPMIVVPNHLVKQWASDFYRLYPNAKILAATKKDFERANRRAFLARIATGDWDAVVIAHSSFGFIAPDPVFESEFNKKQIAGIMAAIQELGGEVGKKDSRDSQTKRTVKQLMKLKESLENRIKALRDKPVDSLLDFAQIGVDYLFVDEAHNFKNLMYATKMQNVRGMNNPKGSQRAFDMYIKTQQVMAKHGSDRGVVFATGTPVSNSLAEMYHMMRYLMPSALSEMGFSNFDAWADTFASVDQVWMQSMSGSGYKATNRMASFVNAPELLKIFDQVADTVTNEDVQKAYSEENEGAEFPLPKLEGGRREPVSLKLSKAQADYMLAINERAKELEKRKGPPQKGDDNMLSILGDARKAAMDIRLVDHDVMERDPQGRVAVAAESIVEFYRKYDAARSTQLVFSDMSTPLKTARKEMAEYQELADTIARGSTEEVLSLAEIGDEAAKTLEEAADKAQEEMDAKGKDWLDAIKAAIRGFSIYDDLRAALIENGIPAGEIAFIHDYNTDDQKAALFKAVNNGKIRVLMGSTPKMGAGTNVQERMVALHHLDVPWRPSDVEQREGRIVRQGNVLAYRGDENQPDETIPGFKVSIRAYATQDTLDLFMWQLQEQKLKMIGQLRTGKVGREVDNAFEELEMSAGEMQAAATSNPYLMDEIKAKDAIKKLERKKRAFESQQNDILNRKAKAEKELAQLPAMIAELEAGAKAQEKYQADVDTFLKTVTASVAGQAVTGASAIRSAIEESVAALETRPSFDVNGTTFKGVAAVEAFVHANWWSISNWKLNGSVIAKDKVIKAAEAEQRETAYAAIKENGFEFNGKTYKSATSLGEAVRALVGDQDAARLTVDGKDYVRRSEAEKAFHDALMEAIETDTEKLILKIGDFSVFAEGVHGKKDDEIGVSYMITAPGYKTSGDLVMGNKEITTLDAAKAQAPRALIQAALGRMNNISGSLMWYKEKLTKAKKTLADVQGKDASTSWPGDQELIDAREKHREITRKLNAMRSGKKFDLEREQELEDAWQAKTGAITPLFSRGESGNIPASNFEPAKDQSDAAILNDVLVKGFGDDKYRNAYVQIQVPDADLGTAQALERAFGRRVVAVAAASSEFAGLFAGARTGENPDTLYVTYPRSRTLIATAGHELYHDLAARYPELHEWFIDRAIPYIRNAERFTAIENAGRAEGDKLGNLQLVEELLADFTGDALADPAFLQQLANENPGKFTQLLNAVKQWLNRIIARLQGNNGSSEFISDVKALREYLAQALKVYAEGGSVAERVGPPKFHRAFHGTPHTVDKFSTDKIGTGEGAAAYGYGLYFAGNKEVAEYYRSTLAGYDAIPRDDAARTKLKKLINFTSGAMQGVRDALQEANGDTVEAVKSLRDHYATTATRDDFKATYAALADMIESGELEAKKNGGVYAVELAPKPDEYLDWDKPLSEQSDKVKVALDKLAANLFNSKTKPGSINDQALQVIERDDQDGADLYQNLEAIYASDRYVSELLHSIGIRGIRYLDGSSRSAGEGNHNFVIFDDADVSITAMESRGDYTESNEIPIEPSVDRTLDAATLRDLRREAAGLESPERGTFLTVTADGRAVATGEKGTRVPETFTRFAEKHGLTFDARRVLHKTVNSVGKQIGDMSVGGGLGIISPMSEPMPIEYRESGALYFGESGAFIDRTGKTRFSRGESARTGSTIADIRAAFVKAFGEKAIRQLEANGLIQIVASAEDVPFGVKVGASGRAFWHPTEKRAIFIADRMSKGLGHIELLHEIGEHYGLERMLGDKGYTNLMQRVKDMRDSGDVNASKAWDFVARNYPEVAEGSKSFMHEVLAQLGQNANIQAQPWWKEIIAAAKRFLVKLGFTGMIKVADIQDMVLHSLKMAASPEGGPRGGVRLSEAMASVAPGFGPVDTSSPDFKRWFGKSLVADEDGKPLRMYHGTSRLFDAFDPMASAGWRKFKSMDNIGSWFSSEPAKAEQYAGGEGHQVMPVYLSIARPKVYDSFNDFLKEMNKAAGRRYDDRNAPGRVDPTPLKEKLVAQGYDGVAFTPTENKELHDRIPVLAEKIKQAREAWQIASKKERPYYERVIERTERDLLSVRQELAAFGESTEFDGHYVWVAFEPTQIKSAISNTGEFDPTNQDIRYSKREGYSPEAFAANVIQELSSEDSLFRHPISHNGTINGVMADVYPGAKYLGDHARADETAETGANHRYVFQNHLGKRFDVYSTDSGRVWLDVSKLDNGDGGNQIYAAVANWAYNTRKVFQGDPLGVSADATIRRTSNMLSSAVRFGTTRHLDASPEQRKGNPDAGVEPLKWGSNDIDNLRELIHTFTKTLYNKFPALATYHYDFAKRGFFDKNGKPVTDERFAAGARTDFGRAARSGEGSLRRGVFLKSIMESTSGEDESRIYQIALDGASALVNEGGLRGMFSKGNYLDELQATETYQRLKSAVSSGPTEHTFNNWWHTTVGTMSHLASINAPFGRVFKSVQAYLDDSARFAKRAEEKASGLIPTGFFSKPLDPADSAEIADPIFKATLHKHVLTDEELRAGEFETEPEAFEDPVTVKFKPLTDQQIDYVHQFHDAINQSIEDATSADLLRMARTMVGKELANQAYEAANSDPIAFYHAIRAGLEQSPEQLEEWENLAAEHLHKMNKLRNEGYAPLMRFGKYTLYFHQQDENGNDKSIFFTMFDSEPERNAAEADLRKQIEDEFGPVEVERNIQKELASPLFEGMTPEMVESFATALGVDQDAAYQEFLKKATSNRSTLRRLIHRKGTAGYSTDVTRVLASFVVSNARRSSSVIHMTEARENLEKIQRGDVFNVAKDLVNYVQDPVEEAGKLRGFMFFNFLGGSLASAMVNYTQVALQIMPYLYQFAKTGTLKEVGSALQLATQMIYADLRNQPMPEVSAELAAALKRAEQEGITQPNEIHQLMAEARGGTLSRDVGKRAARLLGKDEAAWGAQAEWNMQRLMRGWGAFFGIAEQSNRLTAFIAAHNIATQKGMGGKAAYEFAKKAVIETASIYNKGNRPEWARGAVGATVFTFKQFSVQYLEFMRRLYKNDKEAFAVGVGILILMAGVTGLPGSDDLDDIIDTMGQWMGYPTNTKRWRRKHVESVFGRAGADFVLNGVSAILPVDIHARLGLGNLIPGTGMLNPARQDKEKEVLEVLGPFGGLTLNYLNATKLAAQGDVYKAIESAAPTAIGNLSKGVRMGMSGYAEDRHGKRVADVTTFDAFMKSIGIQPDALSDVYKLRGEMETDKAISRNMKSAISDMWAEGVAHGDSESVRAAMKRLREWNSMYPDYRITIRPGDVFRKARELKTDAKERFLKYSPKDLRERFTEEFSD